LLRRSDREERFLDLVRGNDGRLTRIARAYAGADWADLRQEILLQVWKGLDRFEGRSSANTWLYRVALNTALTWKRTAGTSPPLVPQPAAMPEPAGDLDPRDPVVVLQEFVQALGAVDRAILLLYLEDASYADIAEITGLGESHVGVRLHRIKRAFTERYIQGRAE
jgi:RNA polymerase sigma-70 factor (ECF subfamily)